MPKPLIGKWAGTHDRNRTPPLRPEQKGPLVAEIEETASAEMDRHLFVKFINNLKIF